MQDQALAWKAGFGTLVLAFCAVSWLTRKDEGVHPAPSPVQLETRVPEVVPLPPQQLAAEANPPDVADTQEEAPAARVRVTLHDDPPPLRVLPPAMAAKPRAQPIRHVGARPPRVHFVAAKRKPSPYQPGRKHYPYDPRERWALRDAP